MEVRVDGVDGFEESDEDADGVHLCFFAGGCEVAVGSSPESVLVEFASGEGVEVGDVVVGAPAGEELESGAV